MKFTNGLFLDRLLQETKKGHPVVIPDIKCFSPKEGDLLLGRNPVEVAISLVNAGAPVLSVVTEPEQFKGSMELLKKIAAAVEVPILRKDFIHRKEDLIATKESGASAILLMCSCLSKEDLRYLYQEALDLGLDPFVETHTLEELKFATEIGAKLVGINNRSILELECDDGNVSKTCDLAAYASQDALLVSESSLMTPEDVRCAIRSGAHCALVGTALWQAEDPASFYQMLCSPVGVKICGLQRQEDVKACMGQGVEILGFVTEYPIPVPWNLKKKEAQELLGLVTSSYRTCLVTGGKPTDILRLAKELKPNLVQLHYHETLEETKLLADQLEAAGIATIKTVPLSTEEQLLQFGTTDLKQIVEQLCTTKVSALLVDARGPANVSEMGRQVDQEVYRQVKIYATKKVILAGGINPDNVGAILKETGAEYLDIMTGIETTAGVKDADKLDVFMRAVRDH